MPATESTSPPRLCSTLCRNVSSYYFPPWVLVHTGLEHMLSPSFLLPSFMAFSLTSNGGNSPHEEGRMLQPYLRYFLQHHCVETNVGPGLCIWVPAPPTHDRWSHGRQVTSAPRVHWTLPKEVVLRTSLQRMSPDFLWGVALGSWIICSLCCSQFEVTSGGSCLEFCDELKRIRWG